MGMDLTSARAWGRVEPYLEELRGRYAAEGEGRAGRPDSFEDFIEHLREGGAVTAAAAAGARGPAPTPARQSPEPGDHPPSRGADARPRTDVTRSQVSISLLTGGS
ncbi:hypothetical protein QFZ71_005438 [Streptomyces sp. V2I9]|nr:hypothetical protein [Streptomyces sp. V2I9]